MAQAREGLEHALLGRFFEAHESWELAWLARSGHEKLYLQALIQTAAALHHASAGNARGRASLLEKARVKLATLASASFKLPAWASQAGLPEVPLLLQRLHAVESLAATDSSLFQDPAKPA